MGRRNWLFADAPKGANASAAVYSIVETAKANGLDVLEYLTYLLIHMPGSDYLNYPEFLEALMPWSEECQALFKKESKDSKDENASAWLVKAPCCRPLTVKVLSSS